MRKTLYNTSANSVCGKCNFHHCSVTVKQMKAKKCLAKQCNYFYKYEEHPYWKQREALKAKKKAKKKEVNANDN